MCVFSSNVRCVAPSYLRDFCGIFFCCVVGHGLNTQYGRRRHAAPQKTQRYEGATHPTFRRKNVYVVTLKQHF
jgi:hypothetical protein